MAKNLISGRNPWIVKGKGKKVPVPAPRPFPVVITIRVDDLTSIEGKQVCRALATYPDGWAFSGDAIVQRHGPKLRVSFKGSLDGSNVVEVFVSARVALQECLARHEERERWLDERVCEDCALGQIDLGCDVRREDTGTAIVSVLVPRRKAGSEKIVTLVADLSQDFKEYRCPECGNFEEFLGLRRRDLQ